MEPEDLRLAMMRHDIKPNEDGSASMIRNGQTIIVHGESAYASCEALAKIALGEEECATLGHVVPSECWDSVAAFVCARCGRPVPGPP